MLSAVIAASRRPAFFGEGRVADTLTGRFEIMTLNAVLVLVRLRDEPGAGQAPQLFTDKLFRHFDAGLREDGVGDLTVPKRMRALAGDFYGRLDAYTAALGGGGGLEAAVGRNILRDEAAPFATVLAAYAVETARLQAAAPLKTFATVWADPA